MLHKQMHVPAPVTTDEIRKMVLKLRWIGHEAEAEQLRQRLDAAVPGEFVAIGPPDTD